MKSTKNTKKMKHQVITTKDVISGQPPRILTIQRNAAVNQDIEIPIRENRHQLRETVEVVGEIFQQRKQLVNVHLSSG